MSGRYIVVFKDNATIEQVQEYAARINSNGGKVTHKYDKVMKGLAAEITSGFLVTLQSDSLMDDSPIDYIEPDGVVTTQ